MSRSILFDTETTGLEPTRGDRVIEIAALELVNDLPTGAHFHTLIDPERDVPAEATRIHGYGNVHLEGAPKFAAIAGAMLDFFGDGPLVAHNAPFDRKVLFTCCDKAGLAKPDAPFLCTVRIARTHWKFKPANLAYVSEQLGIALKHHDAASDALACASITAQAMLEGYRVEAAMLGPPSY